MCDSDLPNPGSEAGWADDKRGNWTWTSGGAGGCQYDWHRSVHFSGLSVGSAAFGVSDLGVVGGGWGAVVLRGALLCGVGVDLAALGRGVSPAAGGVPSAGGFHGRVGVAGGGLCGADRTGVDGVWSLHGEAGGAGGADGAGGGGGGAGDGHHAGFDLSGGALFGGIDGAEGVADPGVHGRGAGACGDGGDGGDGGASVATTQAGGLGFDDQRGFCDLAGVCDVCLHWLEWRGLCGGRSERSAALGAAGFAGRNGFGDVALHRVERGLSGQSALGVAAQ